ncbi:hypothetical protein GDO78_021300 [Eleutherodactylus coqui]|uniref:Uncharacterized protein n=1 Tax=Eleutherodactylus coqui TaxID=57060 RepID=A0A8J6BBH5_ELECQ|nr:hypothetical protein GDO78_021300 [Eleutherodactylus coqui]
MTKSPEPPGYPRINYSNTRRKNKNGRVPLVVTYNSQLEELRKTAKKLHHTLHKDGRLTTIFPDPPLLCYRQPPNLRNFIIRSALSSDTQKGTYPCNVRSCKTCPHVRTTDRIQIPNTQQDYKIPGTFTCSTSDVVYLIRCSKYPVGGVYVVETRQKLKARMRSPHD